eukprot:Hpha_TRINITY_DN15571_c0_g1::TRINITY_DN15571_c0_g1_i1::g.106213::m.106213
MFSQRRSRIETTEATCVPPFAHNPTVKAHNGSWYIYHIGTGESYKPFMGNCSDGVTPKGQVCGKNTLDGPAPLGGEGPGVPNVLYSGNGSAGPWKTQKGSSGWAMNNPTVYIHPNGTTLAIYKVACN